MSRDPARPHGAEKTSARITYNTSCLMAEPHFKRASAGPECSKPRASSIIPNSSVLAWVSTGIRPVSDSTTRKNATATNRCAGLMAWAKEERSTAAMA